MRSPEDMGWGEIMGLEFNGSSEEKFFRIKNINGVWEIRHLPKAPLVFHCIPYSFLGSSFYPLWFYVLFMVKTPRLVLLTYILPVSFKLPRGHILLNVLQPPKMQPAKLKSSFSFKPTSHPPISIGIILICLVCQTGDLRVFFSPLGLAFSNYVQSLVDFVW